MLCVRKPVREDMPELGRIMAVSFRTGFAGFISRETLDRCAVAENCAALLENLFAAGEMEFLLAAREDQILGELIWCCLDEETAEIQAIHSLPESWGTGVGAELMDRALEDMKRAGKKKVILWAFADNGRARRFYEKWGFAWDGSSRMSDFDGAEEVRYWRTL